MDITVTFIGNATTLLTIDGITLLTDPNFLHRGQHAYLGYGLLSKRLHDPALDIDRLPALDAVLLSHMHGDHWDRVAQNGLDRSLPVVTTPHAAKRLRKRGFGHLSRSRRGSSTRSPRAAPRSPSPRYPDGTRRRRSTACSPVMGSMVEVSGPDGSTRRLYISGDTLLIEELSEIPRRFPDIDAGVLHLGGTRLPFGRHLPVGLTVTMDGRQGAGAAELLDLPKVIPVHFNDYGVFASPLSDFLEEMKRRGLAERVIELDRGASVTV